MEIWPTDNRWKKKKIGKIISRKKKNSKYLLMILLDYNNIYAAGLGNVQPNSGLHQS